MVKMWKECLEKRLKIRGSILLLEEMEVNGDNGIVAIMANSRLGMGKQ